MIDPLLLSCPRCTRLGHSEECRTCLGEGTVPVPVEPAPVQPALPEWTEEAVEREVARVLSWHRVSSHSGRARSIAHATVSLCERPDPLAVLTALVGDREVADLVVCAMAAALRGEARGQRAHRYGRDAERCEQAARRLDRMADSIEAAALREMRRRAG